MSYRIHTAGICLAFMGLMVGCSTTNGSSNTPAPIPPIVNTPPNDPVNTTDNRPNNPILYPSVGNINLFDVKHTSIPVSRPIDLSDPSKGILSDRIPPTQYPMGFSEIPFDYTITDKHGDVVHAKGIERVYHQPYSITKTVDYDLGDRKTGVVFNWEYALLATDFNHLPKLGIANYQGMAFTEGLSKSETLPFSYQIDFDQRIGKGQIGSNFILNEHAIVAGKNHSAQIKGNCNGSNTCHYSLNLAGTNAEEVIGSAYSEGKEEYRFGGSREQMPNESPSPTHSELILRDGRTTVIE